MGSCIEKTKNPSVITNDIKWNVSVSFFHFLKHNHYHYILNLSNFQKIHFLSSGPKIYNIQVQESIIKEGDKPRKWVVK